ncbi:MAG: response regulator transcription factor [Comamonadaceae bacterium]|nr:MAG: response regulator transcription factor [Comamonadaceae bacterium]
MQPRTSTHSNDTVSPRRPGIRVGVVDDHPVVRAGLAEFLADEADMSVGGVAADAAAALALICNQPLDVLLLDLDMPGRSGLDVLASLRSHAPELPILVFTGYPADKYAVKLLQQGAAAYLQKTCELWELSLAIRTLAEGRRYLNASVSELLAQQFDARSRPPHADLTDRELQVLLKLARGVRLEKIADHLALSLKTISTYRARLLAKLDLDSSNDLTYYALKHQLLE